MGWLFAVNKISYTGESPQSKPAALSVAGFFVRVITVLPNKVIREVFGLFDRIYPSRQADIYLSDRPHRLIAAIRKSSLQTLKQHLSRHFVQIQATFFCQCL